MSRRGTAARAFQSLGRAFSDGWSDCKRVWWLAALLGINILVITGVLGWGFAAASSAGANLERVRSLTHEDFRYIQPVYREIRPLEATDEAERLFSRAVSTDGGGYSVSLFADVQGMLPFDSVTAVVGNVELALGSRLEPDAIESGGSTSDPGGVLSMYLGADVPEPVESEHMQWNGHPLEIAGRLDPGTATFHPSWGTFNLDDSTLILADVESVLQDSSAPLVDAFLLGLMAPSGPQVDMSRYSAALEDTGTVLAPVVTMADRAESVYAKSMAPSVSLLALYLSGAVASLVVLAVTAHALVSRLGREWTINLMIGASPADITLRISVVIGLAWVAPAVAGVLISSGWTSGRVPGQLWVLWVLAVLGIGILTVVWARSRVRGLLKSTVTGESE